MIEEILSLPRHDESSKETGLNRIKRKRMISSIMTGFFYAGAFGAALLLTIFVAFVIGQGFLSVNPDILDSLSSIFFNTLYLHDRFPMEPDGRGPVCFHHDLAHACLSYGGRP